MKEFVLETEDPGMLFESIFSIGFGSTLLVQEETFFIVCFNCDGTC
jgi:hypothetical protein